MVNLYDSPAQAQFVNTYVPIQFESLYKLTDKAGEDMKEGNALMDKINEFRNLNSMSEVDNAIWDNEFGKITDFVNNDIRDVYSLQDPIVRNKLFSTVRQLSSNKLFGKMIKNKELYEKFIAKSDPRWGEYYSNKIKNNNTAESGLWTDNPMEWNEWTSINDAYTKDIGTSLYKHDGMYDVYRVNPADYNAVLTSNMQSIMNDPISLARAEADYYNGKVTDPKYFTDKNGNKTGFNKEQYAFDMVFSSGIDKLTEEKRVFNQDLAERYKEAGRNRRFNIREANRKKELEVPNHVEWWKQQASNQMAENKRSDVSNAISNAIKKLGKNATAEQIRAVGEGVFGKEAYVWYTNSIALNSTLNAIKTKENEMSILAANGKNTDAISNEIKSLKGTYQKQMNMVQAYLPEVDRQIAIDENNAVNNKKSKVFTRDRVLLNNKINTDQFIDDAWYTQVVGPKTSIKTSGGMTINGFAPMTTTGYTLVDLVTGKSNFSTSVIVAGNKRIASMQPIADKVNNGLASNSLTPHSIVIPSGQATNENGYWNSLNTVAFPIEAVKQKWGLTDNDIKLMSRGINGVSIITVNSDGTTSTGTSTVERGTNSSTTNRSSSSNKNTIEYLVIPTKSPYVDEDGSEKNGAVNAQIFKQQKDLIKSGGTDEYNSFGVSYSEEE